jgi:tetratricopeptide (TPR) repeat protein
MRQYGNTDIGPEPMTTLELTIKMEVEDFDGKNQRWLQYAIAAFLEIQPNAIRIVSTKRGSVKVTIKLPKRSAERLLSAYERHEPELVRYLDPLVLLDLRQEAAGRGRLPALQQIVIANARYWLGCLNARTDDDLIPESDIRGAARALEAVMTVSEAWPLAQSLAAALHPHVERRGYWADWDDFLQGLVARARQRSDPAAEAELLAKCGGIQRERGSYQAAVISYRRAWWLCRRAGDQVGRARALSNLGDLYRLQGRLHRAEALCRGALALFETLEDVARLAYTENHLGLVYYDQERWSEALPHLARSEALWRQVGDRHGLAKTLQNLGLLHRHTGDLEAALGYFGQAIRHYRAVGDEIHLARTRLNVGNVYLNQSDLLRAERAYSRAETVLKRMGDSLDLARARHNLGIVYTRLNDWTEAEACFERALEQWRNREDAWDLANTLGELSGLHIARGRWTEAQSCLDEAWKLVSARREAHYSRLWRELAGRRQELDRLVGPTQRGDDLPGVRVR